MATSLFGDSLWGFVVIGGFLILAAALAFAKFGNRVTPEQERRTEQATRELYEEQSAEDDARSG